MINAHFVILGAVITFFGGLTYVVATLKGRNQPNLVSWFMWTLIPMVAFAAEIKQGVGLQSLMTFMAGFNPLLIVVASLFNKKTIWKLTAFDFGCGAVALLGLVFWLISGHGNIAIVFSIVADAAAAVPTIVKAYGHPQSEGWFNFFCAGLAAGITLLTLKHWTFAGYGFPLYLLVACLILTLLVRFELGLRLKRLLAVV